MAGVVQSAESPLPVDLTNEGHLIGKPSSWDEDKPTYTVQAGYEGYLVPAESQSIFEIIRTEGIFGAIPILTKCLAKVALKVTVVVVIVLILKLLVNFGLCRWTSFCPSSFQQRWDRSIISDDQIQYSERLLDTALNKFHKKGLMSS
ncbi:uncharacterized protein [Halyomorpha halys]|uniref:uncharacterized protein n=1 Tax=Halyomorpha halys TaxID=286706 RepID=UPI0006D4DE04|nr:uncharacterized protein LOC106683914 [Halyomorpha halys]